MIERYSVLCSEIAGELDPLGQTAAAQHLVELVGHFVENSSQQKDLLAHHAFSMARLDLVKAYILKNLDKCNLTI